MLHRSAAGVRISTLDIHGNPATLYRPDDGAVGPVVVIAHGFAGSQQLMQSFALAFARNGYVAVTFDFPGHGRNAIPLTGSITETDGATRTLVGELRAVADAARPLGDGRLAVLGHSMATDIVVRFAQSTPRVGATIAVSLLSPVVTDRSPGNLLIIVGDWETMLKREALRAVGLATLPAAAAPGVTYGDPARGSGRRMAVSPHVEHVSVLYSEISLREALAWLDAAFGVKRAVPPVIEGRGPWIMLLFGGIVLLAGIVSAFLPRVAAPGAGAGLGWSRIRPALLLPMIVTPLLLRIVPTHFLPVLVADYLAVHFAVYGLITAACLAWTLRASVPPGWGIESNKAFLAATTAVVVFGFAAVVWPIDSFFTSFRPGPGRAPLMMSLLAGTLIFFLSDEWLTRGVGAARGAYAASKAAFLMSLAAAVALDPARLFFLVIIVPEIVLFFWVYGLFSAWTYRQTGHPFVAGLANAVAFAWAIGVTFPLLAG